MKNNKINNESTTEEKLKSIETRLKNLYKNCPKNKRKKILKPILSYTKKTVCINQKTKLLILSVFVAISAFIILDPDMFYIRATTKKSFIWLFPDFDYDSYFDAECLINNPYIQKSKASGRLEPAACKLCEHLVVEKLRDVDRKNFSKYLLDWQPVIVTDAMKKWNSTKLFSDFRLKEFVKLHFTLPEFRRRSSFCSPMIRMSNKTINSISNIPSLFDHIVSNWNQNELHFSASWTNCNKNSYNAIRDYYDKAYFLPDMTEVNRYKNSVLLSSRIVKENNDTSIWARFRENMDGMWIAQIHGVMQFRLVPKHECREKCNHTKVTLRKGQVLNVVNALFSVYFRSEQHHAVAISVGYQFN